ncbi:MAG: 4-hydroxybenzoate octaprenyltransferase [Burkholderiales bacterium]
MLSPPPELAPPTRIALYARLTRLHKPIGTLLLLWPTLWAVWIAADGHPAWWVVTIFCVGTLLMRSAGCAMNDLADADFDRYVKRTRDRPLAAGLISRREAVAVAVVLSLIAFTLVLAFNRLTIALAFVALFLAASYPFTKRFLSIPQAYLGIAFGFGIPMAFAAQLDAIPPTAWALLAANIIWAIAYDTEYAMVDRDDDVRIGIKTAAITFGRFDIAAVLICYAITLGILASVGVVHRFGWAFYAGLGVAAGMAIYHYTLIRTRSREGCFAAFNHNNWFGAAVFIGIWIDYALRT